MTLWFINRCWCGLRWTWPVCFAGTTQTTSLPPPQDYDNNHPSLPSRPRYLHNGNNRPTTPPRSRKHHLPTRPPRNRRPTTQSAPHNRPHPPHPPRDLHNDFPRNKHTRRLRGGCKTTGKLCVCHARCTSSSFKAYSILMITAHNPPLRPVDYALRFPFQR